MGDQKDKAATRKTYIKKTSILKLLPKKCLSNAIFVNYGQYARSSPILREICNLRRDLRRCSLLAITILKGRRFIC